MKVKIGYLILSVFFIYSCKKETPISFDYQIIDTGKSFALCNAFFLNDSTIFTGGGEHSIFGRILKSTDYGKTWSEFITENVYRSSIYDIYQVSENVIFAGGDSLRWFISTDKGVNWTKRWVNYGEASFHEIHRTRVKRYQFLTEKLGFYVGGNNFKIGHFYKTVDQGNSWTFDTLEHELNGLDFFNENLGIICGYGYIGKTTDGGKTFEQLNLENDYFKAVKILSPTTYIIASDNGIISKSYNAGKTWKKVFQKKSLSFNDLKFISSRVGFAIGSFGAIYCTTDSGESWQAMDFKEKIHLNKMTFYQGKGIVAGSNGKIYVFKI